MHHIVKPATLRRRTRKTARIRGQALVELAIVLPVFLVLVLAAIDLGRIFFARITVANSAREGAYEASYGGSFIANTSCGASNSVMCAILNESQGSLTVAPADVAWSCSRSGGCTSGAYGDAVTIKVTGHFQLLTPILAVFFGGTNVAFSSTASADMIQTPYTGTGVGSSSAPSNAPTAAPTATVLPTVTPFPTPSGIAAATPTPSPPVCSLPVASFTWTQENGKDVRFTSASTPASGTCAITFWRWEFGDNTTSAGNPPTIVHTYPKNNEPYLATLTVTNPAGIRSVSIWVTS